MLTLLKFFVGVALGSLAWLVTGYTVEYFRPYSAVRTKVKVRKD